MSDHKALNQTYNERNTLMIALARTMLLLGHKAGYGIDQAKADLGWDADWSTVVYIDLPDGSQLSYHMNNDTAAAARTLPLYPGAWDGTWLGREVPDWLLKMRDLGRSDDDFGDAVAKPTGLDNTSNTSGRPVFELDHPLHDFVTHRGDWRNAIEARHAACPDPEVGEQDDQLYWLHQLGCYDRAMTIFDQWFNVPAAPRREVKVEFSVPKAKDGSPMFSGARMTFPNLMPEPVPNSSGWSLTVGGGLGLTVTTGDDNTLFIPASKAPSPNSIITSTPEMSPVTRDQMTVAIKKLRDAVGDDAAKELVYRTGNAPRVAMIEANYFRAVLEACEAKIAETTQTQQVPK